LTKHQGIADFSGGSNFYPDRQRRSSGANGERVFRLRCSGIEGPGLLAEANTPKEQQPDQWKSFHSDCSTAMVQHRSALFTTMLAGLCSNRVSADDAHTLWM
jgi:hypothetical protein